MPDGVFFAALVNLSHFAVIAIGKGGPDYIKKILCCKYFLQGGSQTTVDLLLFIGCTKCLNCDRLDVGANFSDTSEFDTQVFWMWTTVSPIITKENTHSLLILNDNGKVLFW